MNLNYTDLSIIEECLRESTGRAVITHKIVLEEKILVLNEIQDIVHHTYTQNNGICVDWYPVGCTSLATSVIQNVEQAKEFIVLHDDQIEW